MGIVEAALPMVGVLVGAFAQYWFSTASEKRKEKALLRIQAYADFLQGVAESAIFQKAGDMVNALKATALVLDAKARICVYGDAKIVSAVANFWRTGAALHTPEQHHAFVDMCLAMREDSLPNTPPVSRKDISQCVLGTDG